MDRFEQVFRKNSTKFYIPIWIDFNHKNIIHYFIWKVKNNFYKKIVLKGLTNFFTYVIFELAWEMLNFLQFYQIGGEYKCGWNWNSSCRIPLSLWIITEYFFHLWKNPFRVSIMALTLKDIFQAIPDGLTLFR